MAKKRKKIDPEASDRKRRTAASKNSKHAAPATPLKVRQAGPRYFVAAFGPVTMEMLAPTPPAVKDRRRKD